MKTFIKMPMNLQFFADGGEGANRNQGGLTQKGAQNTQTTTEQEAQQDIPAQQGTHAGTIPKNFSDLLIQALEARTARAEKSVTHSITV